MKVVALELFTRDGGIFLSRYAHYLAGVTWIGLLYYFNFVQTPAFTEFDAPGRTEAIAKLVPRALWWFRWGALLTVLSGFTVLAFQDQFDGDYFKTTPGISISTGVLLGLIMFGNVWGVIWRNQKVVIASAKGVMDGKPADPEAAAAARRGAIASRTNTVFSIPLLFFMGFTSHLAGLFGKSLPEGSDRLMFWLPVLVVVIVMELNALGVFGVGPGTNTKYLDTHRNAIITGFALATVFYLWFEVCFS
jgi:uncharacterized membrane protein